MNTEQFQEKLNNLRGKKFLVLSNYINNNSNILIKCNNCNFEWLVKPMTLTRSKNPTGCPKCSHRSYKKTTEEFKEEVFNLTNGEYEVIGEYINNKNKIEILHKKCKNIFKTKPHDFLRGSRCPKCSHRSYKKTTEEFKEEVFNLTNGEYEVIGEYISCDKKIKIKHKKCNNYWDILPRNFLSNNNRCPYCCNRYNSIPILFIKDILKKLNLKYKEEIYFKNLKYKNYLFIDFYLIDLDLYIEYDGQQHFKKGWMGIDNEESFKNQKIRDNIKNEYFIKNELNLLRLDITNYKFFENIIKNFKEGSSTTIEKYNCYFIKKGNLINDNKKYYI